MHILCSKLKLNYHLAANSVSKTKACLADPVVDTITNLTSVRM